MNKMEINTYQIGLKYCSGNVEIFMFTSLIQIWHSLIGEAPNFYNLRSSCVREKNEKMREIRE